MNLSDFIKANFPPSDTTSDEHNTFHYTLDGSEPTLDSPVFIGNVTLTEPITFGRGQVFKAARRSDLKRRCGDG